MRQLLSRRRLLLGSVASLAGVSLRTLKAEEPPAVPTIDERIRQLADEAPLTMQFKGESADECLRWQRQFAAQLKTMLGPYQPPDEWKTVVERTVDLEDHRREELLLVAAGHPPLPIYLLLPHGAGNKPLAGVLAIHGHGKFGYDPVAGRDELPGVAAAIDESNYDYGRQLVRRGYAVAVPCLTPFGRRLGDRSSYGSQDACGITYLRLQLLGKLLIAENLRDCLWALEMLARHERVDVERLACVGLSYGGRMTMLTAALETRVRAAIVSGALNVMQERVAVRYSCGAQVIPGLLQYGDTPEIGSLIAPRPCVWEAGLHDSLVKPDWAENALARITRTYRALDAVDKLEVDRFEGGHKWSGRLGFPMLERILA